MPYPHTIRLRGPWSYEVVEQFAGRADVPRRGRTTVPADWGGYLDSDFRGRAHYRRSFNPPSTLDPHERLWLIVEGADPCGRISLNGSPLGTVDGYALPASFDVTRLVAARNEVVLEVESPVQPRLRPGRDDLPGGPIGEVRLEVRSTWYIDSLAVWSDRGADELIVSGRIAGDATTGPLSVVVSGCEREIAYHEAAVGDRFQMQGDAAGFPVWTPVNPAVAPLEVKLLSGGMAVWQTILKTALRATPANVPSTLVEQILPDADYDDFDRNGQAIIQCVPRDWSKPVCSRLARHPSIVAWSALRGEPVDDSTHYGRRWI